MSAAALPATSCSADHSFRLSELRLNVFSLFKLSGYMLGKVNVGPVLLVFLETAWNRTRFAGGADA